MAQPDGCMSVIMPHKCLATLTYCIAILQSLAYSPLQVDITDTQLTMAEQVSFTRFLCCTCHDSSKGSAFFGTRRAVELHISRSRGCQTTCKSIKTVPVVYGDSQRQEDHEAGPIGAPGHWPARPVVTASSKGAPPTRHTDMTPHPTRHTFRHTNI